MRGRLTLLLAAGLIGATVAGCGSAAGTSIAATAVYTTAPTSAPTSTSTSTSGSGATAAAAATPTPSTASTASTGSSATASSASVVSSKATGGRGSTTGAAHRFPVCPSVTETDIQGLSDCVHANLVSYWQRLTKHTIDRPVVIEPTFPPQPEACFAPQSIYAYYCPDNRTIYLNTSILTLWRQQFTPDQVPYSLAMTLAHEVGHAAQFAVEPKLQQTDTTKPEVSRPIELQADCLAGVWAAGQIAARKLDRATLLTVWRRELVLLDTPEHREMHGGPDARIAATERGITGGTMAACGLHPG